MTAACDTCGEQERNHGPSALIRSHSYSPPPPRQKPTAMHYVCGAVLVSPAAAGLGFWIYACPWVLLGLAFCAVWLLALYGVRDL